MDLLNLPRGGDFLVFLFWWRVFRRVVILWHHAMRIVKKALQISIVPAPNGGSFGRLPHQFQTWKYNWCSPGYTPAKMAFQSTMRPPKSGFRNHILAFNWNRALSVTVENGRTEGQEDWSPERSQRAQQPQYAQDAQDSIATRRRHRHQDVHQGHQHQDPIQDVPATLQIHTFAKVHAHGYHLRAHTCTHAHKHTHARQRL